MLPPVASNSVAWKATAEPTLTVGLSGAIVRNTGGPDRAGARRSSNRSRNGRRAACGLAMSRAELTECLPQSQERKESKEHLLVGVAAGAERAGLPPGGVGIAENATMPVPPRRCPFARLSL